MAEDLGTPLMGDADHHPKTADFDKLKRIQDTSPSARDMHGSVDDGSVDGYSEARWAGHDFSPAPASAGGNAVAFRLATTPGLETFDASVADREDKLDRTLPSDRDEEGRDLRRSSEGISPMDPAPIVSDDDPSGPDGGDFSKDPQAAVNFWGVLSERDEDGNVVRVVPETEAQDVPADQLDPDDEGDDFDPAEEQDDDVDDVEDDDDDADGEADSSLSYPVDAPSGAVEGEVVYEEGGDRAEHGSDEA